MKCLHDLEERDDIDIFRDHERRNENDEDDLSAVESRFEKEYAERELTSTTSVVEMAAMTMLLTPHMTMFFEANS